MELNSFLKKPFLLILRVHNAYEDIKGPDEPILTFWSGSSFIPYVNKSM